MTMKISQVAALASPPGSPDRADQRGLRQAAPILRLRNIAKGFAGVQALRDVSLDVYGGEVHVILGQNGAGKSSLIKVLYGAYRADGGTIEVEGRAVEIRAPADARRLGISVIFQEFSLVPHLSVAQNIFLGREARFAGRFGLLDHQAMCAAAREVLARIGFEGDPRGHVADLDVAHQQMVEIAKALSQDPRVLVMDEPTAAISEPEAERLFVVIERLCRAGVAVVYISHRMKEVFRLGDRISVLRDGSQVATFRRDEATAPELVRLMIGRSAPMIEREPRKRGAGALLLEVSSLCTERLKDISLTVAAGEVVGLAGLVGAGRTELARAVFGADVVHSGSVRLAGHVLGQDPVAAARCGIALVPEDRKRQGLALSKTVGDNNAASALWSLGRFGFVSGRAVERSAADIVRRLGVKTPSTRQIVRHLSGGNQQKIVLGKWVAASARLFILDEPTRGVDIGAKFEIYALIEELLRDGAGVLLISSELPELIQLADRAYVMRDGQVVGHLSGNELTEEAVLHMAVHHGE